MAADGTGKNPELYFDTDIAEDISNNILTRFYPAFIEVEQRFSLLHDQAPDGA
jgi:hypothetical protein